MYNAPFVVYSPLIHAQQHTSHIPLSLSLLCGTIYQSTACPPKQWGPSRLFSACPYRIIPRKWIMSLRTARCCWTYATSTPFRPHSGLCVRQSLMDGLRLSLFIFTLLLFTVCMRLRIHSRVKIFHNFIVCVSRSSDVYNMYTCKDQQQQQQI